MSTPSTVLVHVLVHSYVLLVCSHVLTYSNEYKSTNELTGKYSHLENINCRQIFSCSVRQLTSTSTCRVLINQFIAVMIDVKKPEESIRWLSRATACSSA